MLSGCHGFRAGNFERLIMSDLIMITIRDEDGVRCATLEDAKAKAMQVRVGKVIVEIIPGGTGRPVITLEFDRTLNEWIAPN